MALRPWRGRQSGRERWKARLCGGGRAVPMCRPKSRRPVPPGLNPIVLDLEVQGLVVGLEVSRRLAFVPLAGLEGPVDRLLLGLGGVGESPFFTARRLAAPPAHLVRAEATMRRP